jgi:hypothetical protein
MSNLKSRAVLSQPLAMALWAWQTCCHVIYTTLIGCCCQQFRVHDGTVGLADMLICLLHRPPLICCCCQGFETIIKYTNT